MTCIVDEEERVMAALKVLINCGTRLVDGNFDFLVADVFYDSNFFFIKLQPVKALDDFICIIHRLWQVGKLLHLVVFTACDHNCNLFINLEES